MSECGMCGATYETPSDTPWPFVCDHCYDYWSDVDDSEMSA